MPLFKFFIPAGDACSLLFAQIHCHLRGKDPTTGVAGVLLMQLGSALMMRLVFSFVCAPSFLKGFGLPPFAHVLFPCWGCLQAFARKFHFYSGVAEHLRARGRGFSLLFHLPGFRSGSLRVLLIPSSCVLLMFLVFLLWLQSFLWTGPRRGLWFASGDACVFCRQRLFFSMIASVCSEHVC